MNVERDRRPGFSGGALYAAIYAVLAIIYFLPAYLPGHHIYGSDYLAAAYFKLVMTSGLMSQGILPAWIPNLYGGVPLFANPASTFYPVKVLADVFLPVTRLLPTIFVTTFFLAGLGTYLLSRELGVRKWLAFLAGLAFQFTGLMMSFVWAGQDGKTIVAAFAPLFFFFIHRGIRKGTLPSFAGMAATLGAGLLSFQIQSNYYLLLGGAIWAVFSLVHLGYIRDPKPLARRVALGLGAVAFGFVLASVNLLPFADYVDASPRGVEGGRGYEYSTSWSMSPREITGLAVPEDVGVSVVNPNTGEAAFPAYRGDNAFKLHTEYVGALVLLLLALGAYYSRRNRYWWFFAGLGLFGLSISLGGNTPLYRLYYALLPATDKFRAPSIAFFLVSFSLVMMAALTLERLASLRGAAEAEEASESGSDTAAPEAGVPGRDPATVAGWLAIAVSVAGLILAGMVNAGADDPGRAAGVFRFTLFAGVTGAALWAWLGGRINQRTALVLLAVLTVADLWVVDRRFFYTIPPPNQWFARDDVVEYLRSQPGRDRVWVLPVPAGRTYRQGNYLMRFHIDQAGGEHGNQLQQYNEFIGAGQQTYVDWHNFLRHPQFLNAANIRYIIAGVQLQGVPWREVHRGSGIIYENPDALPRAYLVNDVEVADPPEGALTVMAEPTFDPHRTAVLYRQPEGGGPEPTETPGQTRIAEYGPNHVVINTHADARSLLVLSDNMYPGWEATVDGQPAEILLTNHTFRGVMVGPGAHEVRFEFRPKDLLVGFWLYVIGSVLLLVYAGFLTFRWWQGTRASDE